MNEKLSCVREDYGAWKRKNMREALKENQMILIKFIKIKKIGKANVRWNPKDLVNLEWTLKISNNNSENLSKNEKSGTYLIIRLRKIDDLETNINLLV